MKDFTLGMRNYVRCCRANKFVTLLLALSQTFLVRDGRTNVAILLFSQFLFSLFFYSLLTIFAIQAEPEEDFGKHGINGMSVDLETLIEGKNQGRGKE